MGRFPVQTLVMVDKNARGGARRNGRFPLPAVGRVNMKRYVVSRGPITTGPRGFAYNFKSRRQWKKLAVGEIN